MVNESINKKQIRLCKFTGNQIVVDESPIYQLPLGTRGSWCGTYCCPGAAAAHLATIEKYSLLVREDLLNRFIKSLRRVEGAGSVSKDAFQHAPDPNQLRLFGGPLTMEQYLETFNYKEQIEQIKQVLPQGQGEGDGKGGKQIPWYRSLIPAGSGRVHTKDQQLEERMPNNTPAVVNWLLHGRHSVILHRRHGGKPGAKKVDFCVVPLDYSDMFEREAGRTAASGMEMDAGTEDEVDLTTLERNAIMSKFFDASIYGPAIAYHTRPMARPPKAPRQKRAAEEGEEAGPPVVEGPGDEDPFGAAVAEGAPKPARKRARKDPAPEKALAKKAPAKKAPAKKAPAKKAPAAKN